MLNRCMKHLEERNIYISLKARQDFADQRKSIVQADPNDELVPQLQELLEIRETIEDQTRRMNHLKHFKLLGREHRDIQKELREILNTISSDTGEKLPSDSERKLMKRLLKNVRKREQLIEEEEYQRIRKKEQLEALARQRMFPSFTVVTPQ